MERQSPTLTQLCFAPQSAQLNTCDLDVGASDMGLRMWTMDVDDTLGLEAPPSPKASPTRLSPQNDVQQTVREDSGSAGAGAQQPLGMAQPKKETEESEGTSHQRDGGQPAAALAVPWRCL
jgi:hypothetical protein